MPDVGDLDAREQLGLRKWSHALHERRHTVVGQLVLGRRGLAPRVRTQPFAAQPPDDVLGHLGGQLANGQRVLAAVGRLHKRLDGAEQLAKVRLRRAARSQRVRNELGNGFDAERLVDAAANRHVEDGQLQTAQNARVQHRHVRLPIDAATVVDCQARQHVHEVLIPHRILVGGPQVEEVRQPQLIVGRVADER